MTHSATAAVDFVEGAGLLMAPTVAVSDMLGKANMALQDFDLYEIHEAFAAQVLCTLKAWEDESYCRSELGREEAMGSIDRSRMNKVGSSLAVGHPFAATGARVLGTLAKQLDQNGSGKGLISGQSALGQSTDAPIYNVFSLRSQATAEVDNDLMIATLAVQAEDRDPAALASKINASMSWAVNVLRPYGALKTKTRDYQTHPRYDTSKNRRLIGWRGNQSLQIETDDFEAAGKAIQKLQERLQVQGIRLTAKSATREAAADKLINEALTSFKERAALIQRNMGLSGYKILDVTIQNDQGSPAYDAGVRSMARMSESAVAQPAIEAGTSRVSVQVYGRVHIE